MLSREQILNFLPIYYSTSRFITSTTLVQVASPLAGIAPTVCPTTFGLTPDLTPSLIPTASRVHFGNSKIIRSLPYLTPSCASNKCSHSPAPPDLTSAHLYRVIFHRSPDPLPHRCYLQFPECIMLIPPPLSSNRSSDH